MISGNDRVKRDKKETYNHLSRRAYIFLLITVLYSFLIIGCNATTTATGKEKAHAWEDMGRSLVMQGNLRGGLAYLLKAIEVDPENADLHHELALVYRDLKEYDLSLTHFKKALSLRPKFPEAYNNLGTLYLLMSQWDLAIESFNISLSDLLYKTPYIAYNNMGWAFYNKGDYEKAINNYKLALRDYPTYAPCHTNLGLAYEALGRFSEAIEAYNKAITCDPDYTPPYYRVGKLYFQQGQMSDALRALKRFVEIVKEGPEVEEVKALIRRIESR
jgi:type IV pilus assembly protein PilF